MDVANVDMGFHYCSSFGVTPTQTPQETNTPTPINTPEWTVTTATPSVLPETYTPSPTDTPPSGTSTPSATEAPTQQYTSMPTSTPSLTPTAELPDCEIIDGPFFDVSCTRVRVSFTTDIMSNGYVYYNLDTPPVEFEYQADDPVYRTDHEVVIMGINPGQQIYLQICADVIGHPHCLPNDYYVISTFEDCEEIQYPQFISLPRQIAASGDSVFLEWILDEQGAADIIYGIDPDDLTDSMGWYEYEVYNLKEINALTSDTSYHYGIRIWDSDGNEAPMTDPQTSTMKTLPGDDTESPIAIGPEICYWIAPNQAIVEITSNEYSRCEYTWGDGSQCDDYWSYSSQASNHHYLLLNNLEGYSEPGYRYRLSDLYYNTGDWSECLTLCLPQKKW